MCSCAWIGCAKDGQLCSCSIIQAVSTESPFSNILTWANCLCWSVPWPWCRSHVEWWGHSGYEVGMSHGREAAPWISAGEVRAFPLTVWSLIIWHLSKSPSALFEVGRHLVIVDNWVKGEINLISKLMCALVPVPCAHRLYCCISHQL